MYPWFKSSSQEYAAVLEPVSMHRRRIRSVGWIFTWDLAMYIVKQFYFLEYLANRQARGQWVTNTAAFKSSFIQRLWHSHILNPDLFVRVFCLIYLCLMCLCCFAYVCISVYRFVCLSFPVSCMIYIHMFLHNAQYAKTTCVLCMRSKRKVKTFDCLPDEIKILSYCMDCGLQ